PTHDRHLQPGGHIAPDDASPLQAALRHMRWRLPHTVVERSEYVQADYDSLCPLDIDTHHVRGEAHLNEPPHYHHDLRYLFIADEGDLPIDDDLWSRHEPLWKPVESLPDCTTFKDVVFKIQSIDTPQFARRRFFCEVFQTFMPQKVS